MIFRPVIYHKNTLEQLFLCPNFAIIPAMAKTKTQYVCQECGSIQPKWMGRCPDCGEWNTPVELLHRQHRPVVIIGHNRREGLRDAPSGQPGGRGRRKTGFRRLNHSLNQGIPFPTIRAAAHPFGLDASTFLTNILSFCFSHTWNYSKI